MASLIDTTANRMNCKVSRQKQNSLARTFSVLIFSFTPITTFSQSGQSIVLATTYVANASSANDKGDYQSAIAYCNKAIELVKNYSSAYYQRGISKSNLKDYRGGALDFSKCIEFARPDEPYLSEPYYNRGVCKVQLGDKIGAMADYTKAIELDKNNAIYFAVRADVKYDLQDYRGAITDYNMVIGIDSKFARAYNNRGLAKIELGQKDSGCLDMSKAGELGYAEAYTYIKKYCN